MLIRLLTVLSFISWKWMETRGCQAPNVRWGVCKATVLWWAECLLLVNFWYELSTRHRLHSKCNQPKCVYCEDQQYIVHCFSWAGEWFKGMWLTRYTVLRLQWGMHSCCDHFNACSITNLDGNTYLKAHKLWKYQKILLCCCSLWMYYGLTQQFSLIWVYLALWHKLCKWKVNLELSQQPPLRT